MKRRLRISTDQSFALPRWIRQFPSRRRWNIISYQRPKMWCARPRSCMPTSKQKTGARHLTWKDIEREQMSPSLVRQYVSAEKTTIARVELKKGCVVPEHSHENEQICYVMQGALKFRMPDSEYVVRTGELLVIPPNLPHEAEAVED